MRKVPTHLRLLRGNPGKRPIKPEPEPSVPEMLPEPPSFLSVDAVNEWWRVVPELRALGLLTVLDVQPLAAYCVAYSHWIAAEQALAQMAAEDSNFNGLMITGSTGSRMANPLVKIARNAAADMLRFAGEFGMTPRARSYLDAAGRLDGPSNFGDLLA
jgi:P27 family predicted phage terminase small subunit